MHYQYRTAVHLGQRSRIRALLLQIHGNITFSCRIGEHRPRPPPTLQQIYYVLILKRNGKEFYFHVHASNQDAADSCIQLLFALEDTYFSTCMVSRRHLQYYSSPARADQQGHHRFDAFYNIEFSSELQRTMSLCRSAFFCMIVNFAMELLLLCMNYVNRLRAISFVPRRRLSF